MLFSRIDERRWNLSSRLIYFMNKRFTRCRARVFVTGCRMAASNSGFCGVRGDKLSVEERCGEVLKMLGNFRRRLRASRDARNTFWFKGSCFSRFDRFRDCDREIFCGRWIMLNVDLFLSIWISKYIFLRINVACEFIIILHHFIPPMHWTYICYTENVRNSGINWKQNEEEKRCFTTHFILGDRVNHISSQYTR